jgi:hypothetical protein
MWPIKTAIALDYFSGKDDISSEAEVDALVEKVMSMVGDNNQLLPLINQLINLIQGLGNRCGVEPLHTKFSFLRTFCCRDNFRFRESFRANFCFRGPFRAKFSFLLKFSRKFSFT